MKKLYVIFTLIFCISLISCGSYVSNSNKAEIKEVVDKVLSYDITYDDELSDYINEDNFYTSNYRFFYTLFLGDLSSFEYSSEMISTKKIGQEYVACLLLNLDAEGKMVYEDGDDEGHKASAQGVDVPIKVTLKKTKRGFYIKSVEEYDTLDIAKEECEGFQ